MRPQAPFLASLGVGTTPALRPNGLDPSVIFVWASNGAEASERAGYAAIDHVRLGHAAFAIQNQPKIAGSEGKRDLPSEKWRWAVGFYDTEQCVSTPQARREWAPLRDAP